MVRSTPADSGDELVAIDWASVGFGAIGEELAPLVASSLTFFEADVSIAGELDVVAFAGYIDGLQEAGAHSVGDLLSRMEVNRLHHVRGA
jgi:hypothetical protein